MPANHQHIETQEAPGHSEEVHEILTYVPNWLVRWGITIVFLSVLMLLALSWYIKYPDVVSGRITITSNNAPAAVVSRTSGGLNLFVKDKEVVTERQRIALINSAAKYKDVMALKKSLPKIKTLLDKDWYTIARYLRTDWRLGELQPYFNTLVNGFKAKDLAQTTASNNKVREAFIAEQIREYQIKAEGLKEQMKLLNRKKPAIRTKPRKTTNEKKMLIEKQMIEHDAMAQKLKKRLRILNKEYETAYESYHGTYKPLFEKKAISKVQLDEKRTDLHNKALAMEDVKAAIDQNQMQVIELQRQSVEMDDLDSREIEQDKKERELEKKQDELNRMRLQAELNENRNQILNLQSQLRELDFGQSKSYRETSHNIEDAYTMLQNQIDIWEQRYVIRAPIAGELNYVNFSKDNMFVKNEQEIAKVLPRAEDKIYGEMFMAEQGSGKVEVGQVLNIELDSYMKKEFGVVKGVVKSISDVTTTMITKEGGPSGTYKVYVGLPNGLKTTAKKNLIFKHNMQGKAEIITKDVRLIERIFNELKTVLDNT